MLRKTILIACLLLVPAGALAQPNLRWKVDELAARYPAEFACAHARPMRDCNYDFSRIVAIELHKLDPSVGANRKRGNGDFSEDALAILGPGGDTVDISGQKSWVIDYIACAGGDPGVCAPSVYWASVGGVSGWVDPKTLKDPRTNQPPAPTPGPMPPAVTPQTQQMVAAIEALRAQVETLTLTLQGFGAAVLPSLARVEGELEDAKSHAEHLAERVEAAHRSVLNAVNLGERALQVEYGGRVPFLGGSVILRPRP